MKTKLTLYSFNLGIIFFLLTFYSVAQQSNETVTDIDGNVYHTVKIGKQVWLVENLKTTRYQNGDSITLVTDAILWGRLQEGAYCNYNNDEKNSNIYGRLYNFYVVEDDRNVCPEGWKVPAYSLWKKLVKNLGGYIEALPKLKTLEVNSWFHKGNNESGFSGLPAGCRYIDGEFSKKGTNTYFWSSTKNSSYLKIFELIDDLNEAKVQARDQYGRRVFSNGQPVYEIVWETESDSKNFGISIRCVKID